MTLTTPSGRDRLNVFKGPEAVADYHNPDKSPPLPLVEIPSRLNPYVNDGVRIYAKMLTALPAQNVKALPALNMLLHEPSAKSKSIVEASSGSTVMSMGMLSRVLWGNEDVTAHVTNKKHVDQLRLLRFFGLKVSLYGGLAQQEPTDSRGIMQRLRRKALSDPNICYPGQYDNEHNWKAHERWTGPQILTQLPEITTFCTTVGTGGCITGTGVYLKTQKPSVKVIGVFNVFGDPTPGPRHFHGFSTCGFPWKDTVDELQEVTSAESYRMSMLLSREGLICGPSSGQALTGLLAYIANLKSQGRLSDLVDPSTGTVNCVFTCSDLPYQYMNGYFERLAEEEFPPIENKILTTCDQDRYDERWELEAQDAALIVSSLSRTSTGDKPTSIDTAATTDPSVPRSQAETIKVLDLRALEDFAGDHHPSAQSFPLRGYNAAAGDIFGNAKTIHTLWTALNELFDKNSTTLHPSMPVLVLCYDGEASRLATSILRGRGVEAFSVLGGYDRLKELIPSSDVQTVSSQVSVRHDVDEKRATDCVTSINIGEEVQIL